MEATGGGVRRSVKRLDRWASSTVGDSNDVFQRPREERSDEEELKWAAIERLPTLSRARKGFISKVLDNGEVLSKEVNFMKIGVESRRILMESVLKCVEEDNGKLLKRLRARIDGVGIELPTVEVRFEELSVKADAYVGSRTLPTLLNATINILQECFFCNMQRCKILMTWICTQS